MSTSRLFVYGTLRPGGRAPERLRRLLETRGRRLGSGTVAGRLHDAGAYPVAVEPTDAEDGDAPRIHGVVYALDEPSGVLPALDAYEGVRPGGRGPFRRDVARVRLESGGTVDAWIYWYERDPAGLSVIPDGRWRTAGDEDAGAAPAD